MKIALTKQNVARIAQSLTTIKIANPNAETPMRDVVNQITAGGSTKDTEEMREMYLRVARYLGWPVKKNKSNVYENGILIWTTAGN